MACTQAACCCDYVPYVFTFICTPPRGLLIGRVYILGIEVGEREVEEDCTLYAVYNVEI